MSLRTLERCASKKQNNVTQDRQEDDDGMREGAKRGFATADCGERATYIIKLCAVRVRAERKHRLAGQSGCGRPSWRLMLLAWPRLWRGNLASCSRQVEMA